MTRSSSPVSNFASVPLPETQDAKPAVSRPPNLGTAGNLSRGRPRDRAEPPASRRSTRKTPGMDSGGALFPRGGA